MIAFDGGQSFARERVFLADPARGACVQEQRQLRAEWWNTTGSVSATAWRDLLLFAREPTPP